MAKFNLESEITAAIAAGAVEVADKKFVGTDGAPLKVRNMESTNDPLNEGDVIEIPTDYRVLMVKFSETAEQAYPCTMVTVTEKDGAERAMRFFPNSLAKNINPIVDGKRAPKVKTEGEVAKWYSEMATVDEAMAQLAGKKIKVTASKQYEIKDYNTGNLRNTNIYKYEWA